MNENRIRACHVIFPIAELTDIKEENNIIYLQFTRHGYNNLNCISTLKITCPNNEKAALCLKETHSIMQSIEGHYVSGVYVAPTLDLDVLAKEHSLKIEWDKKFEKYNDVVAILE